ncbi:hypothetical protein O6H91_Y040500 [Diphasiastrum complanatum]|nr:hypothetical protein O6H91_Y040500 [Diphasiastrum complanatum]
MALEVKNERYRAILRQGRAELQCISEKRSVQDLHQNSVFFPQKKDSCEITCVSVTMDFFIYGTNSGSIVYYYVDDRGPSFINEYRNYETGIQRCAFLPYAVSSLHFFLYSTVHVLLHFILSY